MRRGDNLGSIAGKYNCTVSDLKRWNRLKSTRLMAGQNLAVYVSVKKKSPVMAARVKPAPQPAGTDTAAPANDSRASHGLHRLRLTPRLPITDPRSRRRTT